MKKAILSLLVSAVCATSMTAQTTETTQQQDPDSLYTTSLLTVGTEAPQLEGVVKGKWNVVDFWATWCPDCRREIPTMKALYEKYGKQVNFLGVSFDMNHDALDKYVEENGIKWQQICQLKKMKDSETAKAFGIKWIPSLYLISPDGKVAYTTVVTERIGKKLEEICKD